MTLRTSISGLNRGKRILGIVKDVLGTVCSVKLSTNGSLLTNLKYVGSKPGVGEEVYVDFSAGDPVVQTIRDIEGGLLSSIAAAAVSQTPPAPPLPPPPDTASPYHNDLPGLDGGKQATADEPAEMEHLTLEQVDDLNNLYIPFKNQTGSTISKKRLVMLDGVLGESSIVKAKLAITNGTLSSKYILGLVIDDVINGDDGLAITFGNYRYVDTTGSEFGEVWADEDIIYNNPGIDGALTNIEPAAPNLNLPFAVVKSAHATNGSLLIRVTNGYSIGELHDVNGTTPEQFAPLLYDLANGYWDANNYAGQHYNYWNGSFLESHALSVESDGTTIKATLESSDAGDLTMRFSDGWTALDCTPKLEISLVAGADENHAVTNYIYIPLSTKLLTASVVGFPSEEHNRVGMITVRDEVFTQLHGGLVARSNDHSGLTNDGRGHALHIAERIRKLFGNWVSGCESSLSIVTASSPDDLYFSVTSGFVDQLHEQSFSAMDMSVGDFVSVCNHPTLPLLPVTNFNGQLTDSEGNSLSGLYYTIVLWGVNSSGDQTDAVLANLPSGGYSNLSDALDDASRYTNYTIPAIDAFRNTAFLIGEFTVKHSPAGGGAWTKENYTNLRGFVPNTTAGGAGGASGITTFLGLSDTPLSYAGEAGKMQVVNSGETALEFVAQASGDVVGQGISVADRIAIYVDATGKLIKDGLLTIADVLSRANHTGEQTASTISDFDVEVTNNTDVAANTAKNSYPSADETKLAGIEAGAEVNDVDSVFGRTGVVVAGANDYAGGVNLNNNVPLNGKETGGTNRNLVKVNTSDQVIMGATTGAITDFRMFAGAATNGLRVTARAVAVGGATVPTGGQYAVALLQSSNPTGIGANSAGLIAKNSGVTAELYAWDEAGNVTLLSPHAQDAPATLYDHEPGIEIVRKTENIYLGKIEWVNESRRNKVIQMLVDGETGITDLPFSLVESYAEYSERSGEVLEMQSWDKNQKEIEKEREKEIENWKEEDDVPIPVPYKIKIKPAWLSSLIVANLEIKQ